MWDIKVIEGSKLPWQFQRLKKVPEKLWYMGNWDNEIFENSVTIVGSRMMTRYGEQVISKIVPELVANKITIISGFMYGVDTMAHRTCVDLGGRTVAFLGGGLNKLTPSDNQKLSEEILSKNGLLISEYEPNFKATNWSFPIRDRLLAAANTKGVIVVEAAIDSGSLITAKMANEIGVKVWSVPGPITSTVSRGTNWLIEEDKAKIFTSVDKIMGKTKVKVVQSELPMLENNEEQLIIKYLDNEAMTIDSLFRKTNIDVRKINQILAKLQIKGLVEEVNGLWTRDQ